MCVSACVCECVVCVGCVCVCVCVCVWHEHTLLCVRVRACVRACYPHLHIVLGVSPVPHGSQVAQVDAVLKAQVDLRHRAADLTGHKVCSCR